MRNLSQFVLVGLFTLTGLAHAARTTETTFSSQTESTRNSDGTYTSTTKNGPRVTKVDGVVDPKQTVAANTTSQTYGATVRDGNRNIVNIVTDNPDPNANLVNGKPTVVRKIGEPMQKKLDGAVVPGQPGEPGKADGTGGKGGAGGVSTATTTDTTTTKPRTKAQSEKANKDLIAKAAKDTDPNVQKLLKELRTAKGDDLYKSNADVNRLRAAINTANLSRKAGVTGPIKEASANDVARDQIEKGEPTEAGICTGPDCPRNQSKGSEPIPDRQVDPLRDIARREPPLPPEPPPLPPPPPPVIPAPIRSGPAFGGINQDMLLGGVFGLAAGVLLTKMLSSNNNQNRGGMFPQMGQPMPYGMGGRFPGPYGQFAGGYGGGRFGAPPIAGPPMFGGGLGAPAILPMPGAGQIYNGGYQQSAMGFGSTPVSTSPLMVGGAPAVIRMG